MMKILTLTMGVIFCAHQALTDNYVLETTELPDASVLPSLANGHIGFVVRTPDLTMNGFYNGYIGLSHRARIQNHGNIQLTWCADGAASEVACTYKLHMHDAMFETVYTDPSGGFIVQHFVYPHRFYNRAIVNKITVTRLTTVGEINVRLHQDIGTMSVDLFIDRDETMTIAGNREVSLTCGRSRDVEDTVYQREPSTYCSMSHPAVVPEWVTLEVGLRNDDFYFLTAVDQRLENCRTELEEIFQRGESTLKAKHSSEWHQHWDSFGITVTGDDNLAKTIHASIFYLISSLPSLNSFQPNGPFYGLAPGGLPKGGKALAEYQGHSFWDTETWMHPPVLLMEPRWSEEILNYRYTVRQGAADNAWMTGYTGWRYPWESAFTGREVTPACCPEVVLYQFHITADIAFALRQHLAVTHDMEWFRAKGCEMAAETAKFWESRVQYDSADGLYHIRGVMGPDEDVHNVTNNGYTNINAAYNLYFGDFAACVCNSEAPEDPVRFGKIARNIKLLFDEEQNYHPEYEGYVIGTPIKQADVVLMGYPLMYPMPEDVKRNDLRIYAAITREDGPAMTWAMHIVSHLDIDEEQEASVLLRRTYTNYVREPFKVWSETQPGTVGAGNFITGAGGFLQSFINGYAGVRVHFDRLEIVKTFVPPGTTSLKLSGITYLGSVFRFEVTSTGANIVMVKQDPAIELQMVSDETGEVTLVLGQAIKKKQSETLTITRKTNIFGECQLPERMLIGAAATLTTNKLFLALLMPLFV